MVEVQEKYTRELSSLFWENGMSVDEMTVGRLAYFAELIVDKNATINLISRKDVDAIIENHVFISSFITKFFPDKCTSFLDIGTGGGFPGIPVAITKPEYKGVLVDSTGKKIDSVQEFIGKLKLSNVTTEKDRVESPEFISKYKDSFDLITSRATVPLVILFRYALPLIKNKAYIAALKGGDLEDEYQQTILKYKPYIKKSTIFELSYKPNNVRNQKGKKLVLLELSK